MNDKIKKFDDFMYTEENGEITLVGYTGNKSRLVLPEEIDGKPVTVIGPGPDATPNCHNNIVVHKNIKYISVDAITFGTGMHWISYISVDEDNPYYFIENNTLFTKDGKILVSFMRNKIESYVIPDTVEIIGRRAFDSKRELKKVTFPSGLKEIGDMAFCYTELESVAIPAGVEIIGNSAFANTQIKELSLPDSIRIIGDKAFDGTNMTEVFVPAGTESIGDSAFNSWKTKIVLNGNTKLGKSAAREIAISDNVTDYIIENNLLMDAAKTRVLKFAGDEYTDSVTFPDTIETIDDKAFYNAKNVTKVKLNKGLKYIGYEAFRNAPLKSVTIPASVEYFDFYAFSPLSPKTKISLAKDNKVYREDDVAIYKMLEDGNEEIYKIKKETDTYTVPGTVKKITENSFRWCERLKYLTLSEGVEEFDASSLKNTKVGNIDLPASLITLSNVAEGGCTYSVSEGNKHYFIDNDILYEINGENDYTLLKVPSKKRGKINILKGTTIIGERSFYYCKSLSTVTIPDTVTKIEGYAFCGIKMKELIFPDSITSIGYNAFSGTSISKLISSYKDDLSRMEKYSSYPPLTVDEHVTPDGGVTAEKEDKSGGVRIIPADTKEISREVISDKKITAFEVEDGNTEFIAENGILFNKDKTKLVCYPAGKPGTEYEVPNGIKDIGSAFSYAQLQKITLPASVEALGDKALSSASIQDVFFKGDISDVSDITHWAFDSYERKGLICLHADKESNIARFVELDKKHGRREVILADDKLDKSLEAKKIREKFAFEPTKDGICIVSYYGEDEIVEFPAQIGGFPVTELAWEIFTYESKAQEIVIPEGVKRIGAGAFGAKEWKRIVFPKSLEFIDEKLFASMNGDYKDLYVKDTMICETKAGSYAEKFLKSYKVDDKYDITMLTVLTGEKDGTLEVFDFSIMENGEAKASFKAGYEYDNLNIEKVIIPRTYNGHTVTTVNTDEFIRSNIKEIVITESIKEITYCKYNFAPGLTSIAVDENSPCFSTDGTALLSKDKTILHRIFCMNITSYTVPDGIKTIEKGAFGSCKELTEITLPESIEEIGDEAFYDCKALAKINGIEYVKTTGKDAFKGTAYANALKVVIAGSDLIKYNETEEKTYTVPEGIEEIKREAFCLYNTDDKLEEVVLPGSIKKLGYCAFSGRKNLRKIELSEGLTEIGSGCFNECISLKTLFIPKTVEIIGDSAFPKHKNPRLDYFGNELFPGYETVFKGVVVSEDNPYYRSVDGVLYSKDGKIIYFVPDIYPSAEFEVPDTVCEIKKYAFSGNKFIEKLVFTNTVDTIEDYAFYQCESLKTVVFAKSQEVIHEEAFVECSELDTIEWSSNVKIIGKRAFYECGITDPKLPEGITELGEEAFAENKIKKVIVPKSVDKIGTGVFAGVLEEVTVYDSIERSGEKIPVHQFAHYEPEYIDSNVGRLGIPEFCYGSHGEDVSHWKNFDIIVRSAETEEIKFIVTMPGKSERSSDRTSFTFIHQWRPDAVFDFKPLDADYKKLKIDSLKYAVNRLQNCYELDDGAKENMTAYLSRNAKYFVTELIRKNSLNMLMLFEQYGILKKANIDELIKCAEREKRKKIADYLKSYKEEHFSNKKK